MKIHGRVVSHQTSIAKAAVELWLIKSDKAEIYVNKTSSGDDGGFGFDPEEVEGISCTPKNFPQVKYRVEKDGCQSAEGIQACSEDTSLGNIDLARKVIQIHGQTTSNGHPVPAATVLVHIGDVERASIQTDHEGTFTLDIDGDYEGQRLTWTAKRFGYASATGSISENRSIEADLKLQWWNSRVALGVLLSLVLGLAYVIYISVRCPDTSMTAAEFQKKEVNTQDRQTTFNDCLFVSQGRCGKEKDAHVRQCMENQGYSK